MGWLRRALRGPKDEGLGLILVIGVSVFLFLLAAAAVGLALNGLAQSRNRTNFEKSLANAEAGIDSTLAQVQAAFSNGTDYTVPGSPATCASTPIDFPAAGDGQGGIFLSEASERAWARTNLQFIVDHYPGCIQDSDGGQYVVLKPPSGSQLKYGRIYAMSAMPSFANATRTRIVKDEYVFMPYRPSNAIIAGEDVAISSSTTVLTAAGTDPHTAGVHANGNITGTGNPTIDGPVTYSGTSASLGTNKIYGGTTSQSPTEAIPFVAAKSLYRQAASIDAAALGDWYDLCPNGDVRHYSVGGDPCTGAAAGANIATGGSFRGWTYALATRTWTASSGTLDGTYYVDQANVTTGNGNGSIGRITVIAGAQDYESCGTKRYGNISWDHYSLGQTAFGGLWFLADSDLVTHSNFSAGSATAPVSSGVFVAGDQMNMETSSQGAVGSVIIAAQCHTPDGLTDTSEVKNPTVYYDANADGAFTSIITTALWLDYSGG